jgi:hypothetical protein
MASRTNKAKKGKAKIPPGFVLNHVPEDALPTCPIPSSSTSFHVHRLSVDQRRVHSTKVPVAPPNPDSTHVFGPSPQSHDASSSSLPAVTTEEGFDTDEEDFSEEVGVRPKKRYLSSVCAPPPISTCCLQCTGSTSTRIQSSHGHDITRNHSSRGPGLRSQRELLCLPNGRRCIISMHRLPFWWTVVPGLHSEYASLSAF